MKKYILKVLGIILICELCCTGCGKKDNSKSWIENTEDSSDTQVITSNNEVEKMSDEEGIIKTHVEITSPKNIGNNVYKEITKIDKGLIERIKENLNKNGQPLADEKIHVYSYDTLIDEEELNGIEDISYFDLDNDGIKDKINLLYGSAYNWCEIFWANEDGAYIRGNYNGGIYNDTIPLSQRDETEGMINLLCFFNYEGMNYIMDYNTYMPWYNVRLYSNKELIDSVYIKREEIKMYMKINVSIDIENDNIFKTEGEKLFSNSDFKYPNICYGNVEIEHSESDDGYTISKCDINNDGILENCYKKQYGGLSQYFAYKVNDDFEYFEKMGICKDTLYGFWIDKVADKNVLKTIEYDWNSDISYFRCYIIDKDSANVIFEMQRKYDFEYVVI